MLTYDGIMLGSGEPVGDTYAAIETIISAMQVGYGITTMARAAPDDRWAAGGLTLLPTALLLHGTISLFTPNTRPQKRSHDWDTPQLYPISAGLQSLRVGFSPIPEGFMLEANARW